MARRSDHSREQLAALVVQGARAILRKRGWRAVSMRGVAARIGYAPGSIYNAVGDIDVLLLRINAQTLAELAERLEQAGAAPGLAGALSVADAYMDYVMGHAQLWAALMERPPPEPAPGWYAEPRARLVAIVERVIAPLCPDPAERRQAVLALWASLQGVASLAIGGNMAFAGADVDPRAIARAIVRRYLNGAGQEEDGK
jgi:AcrR family transcriptional regulator